MRKELSVYSVVYVDDFNRKHLTFAKSLKEVASIKNRFNVCSVESSKNFDQNLLKL